MGIFAVFAAAAAFIAHRRSLDRTSSIAFALLIASAAQTAIELSPTNGLSILALLTVLFGEAAFRGVRAGWSRWIEGVWAMCRPIAGWRWLATAIPQGAAGSGHVRRSMDTLLRVILPAAFIGLVFALLLGSGNAVVGRWTSEAFRAVIPWLTSLDLSFGRVVFWLILATLALIAVRPRETPTAARLLDRRIPDFPEPKNRTTSLARSIAIVGLLNALFFAANTADAIYLWTSAALPEGVSYSEFVHQGVYSLTAAVLLSAVVLVLIFQQAQSIRTARVIRSLALLWIAQNVVLIASVLLRLQRYVDAYQLSELRVYVGCFLLLVAVGFGLLTVHVIAHKSLGWLFRSNLTATFALFFVLQFLDVAKRVAETNVARWQNGPSRTLDVSYLASLGASAVPSLIKVAEMPGRSEAHDAWVALRHRKEGAELVLAELDWRSWQQREVRNARLLVTHEVRTQL